MTGCHEGLMLQKVLAIVMMQFDKCLKEPFPHELITENLKFSGTDLDSLDFVEMMQAVESEFWAVPDERWTKIDTPLDIVRELEAARP